MADLTGYKISVETEAGLVTPPGYQADTLLPVFFLYFLDKYNGLLSYLEGGNLDIDLSQYETTTQLDARDTDNRSRANHSGTQLNTTISNWSSQLSGTQNITPYTPTADYHPATKLYVDNALSAVIYTDEKAQDAVGGILSSEFIYDDASGSISINSVSADRIIAGTSNKLFTTTLETKLNGIAAGAEVNVQSDWDALSGDALILNKPDLSVYETAIQLNARDTSNRSRANHTGTQLHSTISDWDTELAGTSNTTAFTPTASYHPATKKYVDDSITAAGGYTNEDAQDAVGAILSSEFTYNDAVGSISINSISASKIVRDTGSMVFTDGLINLDLNAFAIDCSAGSYFFGVASEQVSYSFLNAPEGAYYFVLNILLTGGSIVWPVNVKWPSDLAPDLANGQYHVFIFHTFNAGSDWFASYVLNYKN